MSNRITAPKLMGRVCPAYQMEMRLTDYYQLEHSIGVSARISLFTTSSGTGHMAQIDSRRHVIRFAETLPSEEETLRRLFDEASGVWPPQLFRALREANHPVPHPMCSECDAHCFEGDISGVGYKAEYQYQHGQYGRYKVQFQLQDCVDEDFGYLGPWDFGGEGELSAERPGIVGYSDFGNPPHPHFSSGSGRSCVSGYIATAVGDEFRQGRVTGGLHMLLSALRQVHIRDSYDDFHTAVGLVGCPRCDEIVHIDNLRPCEPQGIDVCESCCDHCDQRLCEDGVICNWCDEIVHIEEALYREIADITVCTYCLDARTRRQNREHYLRGG